MGYSKPSTIRTPPNGPREKKKKIYQVLQNNNTLIGRDNDNKIRFQLATAEITAKAGRFRH